MVRRRLWKLAFSSKQLAARSAPPGQPAGRVPIRLPLASSLSRSCLPSQATRGRRRVVHASSLADLLALPRTVFGLANGLFAASDIGPGCPPEAVAALRRTPLERPKLRSPARDLPIDAPSPCRPKHRKEPSAEAIAEAARPASQVHLRPGKPRHGELRYISSKPQLARRVPRVSFAPALSSEGRYRDQKESPLARRHLSGRDVPNMIPKGRYQDQKEDPLACRCLSGRDVPNLVPKADSSVRGHYSPAALQAGEISSSVPRTDSLTESEPSRLPTS